MSRSIVKTSFKRAGQRKMNRVGENQRGPAWKVHMRKPEPLSPFAQYVQDNPDISTYDLLKEFQEECKHDFKPVANSGHSAGITTWHVCENCSAIKVLGRKKP
jgi:hypothetical protein